MENDAQNSSDMEEKQANEFKNLELEQGVNVWGTSQTTLEQQALREIEIFAQHTNIEEKLEDGEIREEPDKHRPQTVTLDIKSYLSRQEELRKIQEYRKTLQSKDQNKIIADRINVETTKHKNKRKRNDCGSSRKRIKKESTPSISATETDIRVEDKSGSEYTPSDEELNDSDYCPDSASNSNSTGRKKSEVRPLGRVKDDGCSKLFKKRLEKYYKKLEQEGGQHDDSIPEHLEYYTIKRGLKIPFKIWNNLYGYQQDGVRWLWKLHQETTGGILGDEMGLGKTVQVIAFLMGLEYSQVISMHGSCRGLGPTLIVCPATVIQQWVQHFHEWAPELRVAVLHQSGSYQGNKSQLIKEINKNKGVIILTYSGILKFEGHLLEHNWHYLILDEGHKIRNSNAKVSIAVKRIRTPHRLMLTGSPMQNNLQEFWSLFDFTNTGMLGSLNVFMEHFAQPIIEGGFSNATHMQVATALSVASALKNMISPYLLRRTKSDVQEYIQLPSKTEQVLFCSLTQEQRNLYKGYLLSEHVSSILGRNSKNWFSENHMRANVLVAITALRKICNHPDIYLSGADDNQGNDDESTPEEQRFGHYKKSGKMIVVSALLKIWKKQKHRTLLFTQSRTMITVFEQFLSQQGYKYLKMDGSTAVSSRQSLIDKFNEDTTYDVFLLTTRVGGLGINLTGADRVIIYDPDWNPATDTQARERAWRIGQEKQVTIYRLLSAGTIEEKMYQRQVWKQLLSNKVLVDPKTHRFFKSSNLYDLFSLSDYNNESNPETANIFNDSRVKLQEKIDKERKHKKPKLDTTKPDKDEVQFSDDKLEEMKRLAQQISRSIATSNTETKVNKTSYQIELEGERKKRLQEKEELKKLTPLELMYLNREKAKGSPEEVGNKVDDFDTNVSFSQVLEYSGETAKLYNTLKNQPVKNLNKDAEKANEQSTSASSTNVKPKKSKDLKGKHDDIFRKVVDTSGKVDGEKVEGLLKTEIKKIKKKHEKTNSNDSQNHYVLEKLFSKKGVSTALQHDSVMDGSIPSHGLRVSTEAKTKADLALQAIRKSRIDNWRW